MDNFSLPAPLGLEPSIPPHAQLLLVFRFALAWLVDILRPDHGIEKLPLYTLGTHFGSRRILLERPGESAVLFVQELTGFDDSDMEPFRLEVPGKHVAELRLELDPSATARTEGLVNKTAIFDLDLRATCSVHMPAHEELYQFTLPRLTFTDPWRPEGCTVGLEGEMTMQCSARALSAKFAFAADGGVAGKVYRHLGPTRDKIATVAGSWTGSISAVSTSLGAAGLVFDAGSIGGTAPKFSRVVNLRKLGPRYHPRIWTVLLDALLSLDVKQAGGAKAKQAVKEVARSLADLTLKFEPLGTAQKVPRE